jgi:PhzF family phenazine biosynthesis protein
MEVRRIAAFSDGESGGNPAGVVVCDVLPDASAMQTVAAQVGYSETAFAAPMNGRWRVRYFAPEIEVPFCGHATIALGAALALEHGDGIFALTLNSANITVEGRRDGTTVTAALQSPPTRSEPAAPQLLADALALFSYSEDDLDRRMPPAVADAGARHLVLMLNSRKRLSDMRYDLATGRMLMHEANLTTIMLAYAETPQLFHARNPFASGGVYEDPATGAATAAFAGYLRDLDWPHEGAITVVQGEDMGMRSRLRAEIPPTRGTTIRVSGTARLISPEPTVI